MNMKNRMPEKWWEAPEFQAIISGEYYTGAGPDGVVQPDRVAAIDYSANPPTVYHEDETVIGIPGGKQVIPSPQTGLRVPQTPQEQQAMQQQAIGMPGREFGGTVSVRPPENPTIQTQAVAAPTFGGPLQFGPMDKEPVVDTTSKNVLVDNTVKNPAYQDEAIGFTRDVMTGKNPTLQQQGNYLTQKVGLAGAASDAALTQQAAAKGASDDAIGAMRRSQAADTAAKVSDVAAQNTFAQQNAAIAAANALTAQGNVAVGQQQWQKTFDAEQARLKNSDAWSNFEKIAEYGDDEAVRAAWKAATGRDLPPEASINDIRAYSRAKRSQDLAIGEQTIALGNLNIKGTELDVIAKQYGMDRAKLIDAAQLANLGYSVDQVNAQLGTKITPAQWTSISRDYTYAGQVQKATVTKLFNDLSASKFSQLTKMIDDGSTIDQINKYDGDGDGVPDYKITQTDYAAMRNYSAAGQQDFSRSIAGASAAFAAGNIDAGIAALNAAFPGYKMTADRLKTEQQRADWVQGNADFAAIAATGVDWSTALAQIEQGGILDKLGMDEVTAQAYFNTLKQDPSVRAINNMDDSTIRSMFGTGPDDTTVNVEAMRGKLIKFAWTGGISFDASGKPVVGLEAMADLFGETQSGQGTQETTDFTGYTYSGKTSTGAFQFTYTGTDGSTKTATMTEAQVASNSNLKGMVPTKDRPEAWGSNIDYGYYNYVGKVGDTYQFTDASNNKVTLTRAQLEANQVLLGKVAPADKPMTATHQKIYDTLIKPLATDPTVITKSTTTDRAAIKQMITDGVVGTVDLPAGFTLSGDRTTAAKQVSAGDFTAKYNDQTYNYAATGGTDGKGASPYFSFTDSVNTWITQNTGKAVSIADKNYVVVGKTQRRGTSKYSFFGGENTGYYWVDVVQLYDLSTGTVKELNLGAGLESSGSSNLSNQSTGNSWYTNAMNEA